MGTLYLLHFDAPLGSEKHSASHYLGYTSHGLKARIQRHRDGNGARITQVLREKGIGFQVVRVWRHTTKSDERRLKNHHHRERLCPLCNPRAMYRGKITSSASQNP